LSVSSFVFRVSRFAFRPPERLTPCPIKLIKHIQSAGVLSC
jgi:hypothetical protein